MIQVREITEKDFKEAGDMIKKVIRISYENLYPKKLIESFCSKYDLENFTERASKIRNFVAIVDNKIVGIIGLSQNNLRGFYVDPDFQGKGVGRALFDYFENECRKLGIAKITLEGSPIGEPIYKHFGFKKMGSISKERAGIKFTDAIMEKEF